MKVAKLKAVSVAVAQAFGQRAHRGMMSYMQRAGLVLNALPLVVDKIDAIPEAQRSLYVEKDGKFRLDVEGVEDPAPLREQLSRANRESAERRIALKALEEKYAGIDPDKVRALMGQFEDAEEAALLAKGKEGIDQIINKRTEKLRADAEKKIKEAAEKTEAALGRVKKYEQRVLDNAIRIAATGKVHDSAMKSGDVMRAAREIFTLNDAGEPVQIDGEGNVVMSKDSKTPFSPGEWIEERRADCPHWFPAQGSGGGAQGNKDAKGGKDLSGMSPTARMTAARAQK